jgi:hypothetical protein
MNYRHPPSTIVWDGRVFLSRARLEVWLKSRGVNYREWARRHPPAVATADHSEAASSGRQARTVAHPRVSAAHMAPARAAKSNDVAWVGYALAIAAALTGFAIAFRRGIVRRAQSVAQVAFVLIPRALQRARHDTEDAVVLYAISGIAAILVGLGVAMLLG